MRNNANSQMMSTICCRKRSREKCAPKVFTWKWAKKRRTSPVSQLSKSKQQQRQQQQHVGRRKMTDLDFLAVLTVIEIMMIFGRKSCVRIRPSRLLHAFAAISQYFHQFSRLFHFACQHKVSITYLMCLSYARRYNNKCWRCDLWHMLLCAPNEDSIEIQLI